MPSGCYVYAILPRDAALPPDLSGFGGAPLTTVPWRALTAVVSCIDAGALQPTPEHLIQHELVVEAVRRGTPALPVRFGTLLAGEDAVAHALEEHYQVLLSDLARIGDKVELGLTILWTPANVELRRSSAGTMSAGPEPSIMGPGTNYLRTRLAAHHRQELLRLSAQRLAGEVDQILRPSVLAAHYTVLPTPRLALRASYLVQPAEVRGCREAFTAVGRLRGSAGTGKWTMATVQLCHVTGACGVRRAG